MHKNELSVLINILSKYEKGGANPELIINPRVGANTKFKSGGPVALVIGWCPW